MKYWQWVLLVAFNWILHFSLVSYFFINMVKMYLPTVAQYLASL
jgi:hypothetical protein